MVFQLALYTCLSHDQVFNLVSVKADDDGTRSLARARFGCQSAMSSVQLRGRSWEKKAVGHAPSTDSGRPTIRTFCLLLLPSKSDSLDFSDLLSSCSKEHVASSCSRHPQIASAFDSRSVIRCPYSETTAWILSSLVSMLANDNLNSAAMAALCRSSKAEMDVPDKLTLLLLTLLTLSEDVSESAKSLFAFFMDLGIIPNVVLSAIYAQLIDESRV